MGGNERVVLLQATTARGAMARLLRLGNVKLPPACTKSDRPPKKACFVIRTTQECLLRLILGLYAEKEQRPVSSLFYQANIAMFNHRVEPAAGTACWRPTLPRPNIEGGCNLAHVDNVTRTGFPRACNPSSYLPLYTLAPGLHLIWPSI